MGIQCVYNQLIGAAQLVASFGEYDMKNIRQRMYPAIQVILWGALAVMFVSILLLDGKWMGAVFLAIANALILFYSYKNVPSPKSLKGYSVVCGVLYVGVAIVYIISSGQ